jgi:hypothetical protein
MRKPHMAGHGPSERIVVRPERTAGTARLKGPKPRDLRTPVKPEGRAGNARRGVTMDYQMGFTSGPSH